MHLKKIIVFQLARLNQNKEWRFRDKISTSSCYKFKTFCDYTKHCMKLRTIKLPLIYLQLWQEAICIQISDLFEGGFINYDL